MSIYIFNKKRRGDQPLPGLHSPYTVLAVLTAWQFIRYYEHILVIPAYPVYSAGTATPLI